MGAMLLIAIPWIIALSVHYGIFTWTAASGIALQWTLGHQHASFRYFHHPTEGRITSWEEPGELGVVDKIDIGLVEIAQIINLNLFDIGGHLSSFDHFGLLFALTLIAFLWRRRERADRAWEAWRLGLVGVAIIVAPYLFSSAGAERYFFVCLPFMVGSAFGLLNHFERDGKLAWTDLPFTALGKRLPPLIAYLLMTVSLLYPLIRQAAADDPRNLPYVNAKTIAANMKKASVLGPIASIGRGKDVSLYAALLGNVPHYGTQIKLKSVDEIIRSGRAMYSSPSTKRRFRF